MPHSRRHFLKLSSAATLGFYGLNTLFVDNVTPSSHSIPYGYGELRKDPNGIMDLPKGFSYRVISRAGRTMNDGLRIPSRSDGMAAFPGKNGKTVIICNYEIDFNSPHIGPFGPDNELLNNVDKDYIYDRGMGETPFLGGTSNIIFDTKAQTVESQFMSLLGTSRNCAGGPTPWNTWITSEESVLRAGDTFEQDHGYNFEVPSDLDGKPVKPLPLKEMGRFNHEAVAIDPASGIVYETEDRDDSLIYRYIPNTPGKLIDGGKLQMLVVKDQSSFDTRNWDEPGKIKPGMEFDVEWMDAEDVESPEDDLRHRGFEAGAARFARGEGMWTGDDGIYFACTSGGHVKKGQIWKYIPSPNEGKPEEANSTGKLILFVEPNDSGIIDNADNLTVSPWGDLLVCEDGSCDQYLDGVTPDGEIYKFARNANSESELAGVCFSPDASTLFVNIMNDGLTLAITGPWHSA